MASTTAARWAGKYRDAAGKFHGFRWKRGRFTTVDGPGGRAEGVHHLRGIRLPVHHRLRAQRSRSDRGQCRQRAGAGPRRDGEGLPSAEGAKGRFTLFNRPGTTATLAFDINNRGQIVGVAGNIPPSAQRGASMMGVTSELQGGQPARPGSEVDGQDRP
jgi:hypothetical protein